MPLAGPWVPPPHFVSWPSGSEAAAVLCVGLGSAVLDGWMLRVASGEFVAPEHAVSPTRRHVPSAAVRMCMVSLRRSCYGGVILPLGRSSDSGIREIDGVGADRTVEDRASRVLGAGHPSTPAPMPGPRGAHRVWLELRHMAESGPRLPSTSERGSPWQPSLLPC